MKQRAIMASDEEWQVIRARAQTAGMSVSRFVVQRVLEDERPGEPEALPPSVQRRMARELFALSWIEERRLSGQGSSSAWEEACAAADAWLEGEEELR